MSPRRWAALYYFLYFAATACLLPYLNLFYRSLGIPDSFIGILAGLTTLTSIVAGPLWAILADALHIHRRILPVLMLASLPVAGALPFLSKFSTLAVGIIVFGLCLSPVVALADNSVIQHLGAFGRADYGQLRIWGAVGWGLSAWITGLLVERLGMQMIFAGYIFWMAICAWVAIHLPPPGEHIDSEPFWISLRRFSGSRPWIIFLAAVFLVGISTSTIQNFLSLLMKDLGAGESLFGLTLALSSLSELPVFFFSARWLRRFGPRNLVAFAMGVFALRALLLSTVRQPEWAMAIQLLHGLSFSALWAAGVNYAAQLAPPKLGATAQSVFSGVFMGLSSAAGAFGGGWLYGQSGPAVMYLVSGLLAAAGLGLFLLASPARSTNEAAALQKTAPPPY